MFNLPCPAPCSLIDPLVQWPYLLKSGDIKLGHAAVGRSGRVICGGVIMGPVIIHMASSEPRQDDTYVTIDPCVDVQ